MARARLGIVAATAVSAALTIAGCGSTSPVAPTTASSAAQYPSLLGHWVGSSPLVFNYRDTGMPTADGWRCSAMLDVTSQAGGHFSGGVGLNGTGVSEPPCFNSFDFTASMKPDGTIANFRIDGGFGIATCTPVSDATVSGMVTNADMHITITDRAMCRDIFRTVRDFDRVRETDRLLTISLTRRTGAATVMSSD